MASVSSPGQQFFKVDLRNENAVLAFAQKSSNPSSNLKTFVSVEAGVDWD
jgi:hypothetical protein